MGTLRCDRRNCPSIYCTKYSSKHGYICNDCYNKLAALLNDNDDSMDETIAAFMESPKPTKKSVHSPVLNSIFRDIRDVFGE